MESTAPSQPVAATPESTRGLALPMWSIIVAFLVGATAFHIWLHMSSHGAFSVHQAVIVGFLALNVLVNFWEIGLYFTADEIRAEYLDNEAKFEGRPMDRVVEVMNQRIELSKVLSFRQWTGIWSSYCHFDPGYSRRGSFGYNIDVGNGFSTIVPATLFAFGMTYEIVPARVLGIVGVAMFWQMFYGTVVYFFQFFNAGRHVGHTKKDLFIFVGNSNGMWFIFPLWGMLASVWLIYEDSYALFTSPAVTSIWSLF
jgi:hypothetical protein